MAVKEALQAVVQTSDGQTYQGIVLEENPDMIVLKDSQGNVVKIPRDGEENIKKGWLVDAQGPGQPDEPCRFSRPGPIPVGAGQARSVWTTLAGGDHVSSIWRFLKPVPPRGQADDADAAALRPTFSGPTRSAWQPAYAKVAGMLPLRRSRRRRRQSVLYLQAQVLVSEPGRVDIRLDSTGGVGSGSTAQSRSRRLAGRVGSRRASARLPRRHAASHAGRAARRTPAARQLPAAFTVVDGP